MLHHPNLAVLRRQFEQMFVMRLCFRLSRPGDDERRKSEPKRRARPGARSDIMDQSRHVLDRLPVDKPDIAHVGGERARRLGFAADIDPRPLPVRVGGAQRVVRDPEIRAVVVERLAAQQRCLPFIRCCW